MSETTKATVSEPVGDVVAVPAPMTIEAIKAAAQARHAYAVEELARSRNARLEINKRIAALVNEEAESSRMLRAVEGRSKKK